MAHSNALPSDCVEKMRKGTAALNSYIQQNETALRAYVPIGAISVMAVLLSKGPVTSTVFNSKTISNQRFEALLGSVEHFNTPAQNRVGKTGIKIPVVPPTDNKPRAEPRIPENNNVVAPKGGLNTPVTKTQNSSLLALPAPPVTKEPDKASETNYCEEIPDEAFAGVDLNNLPASNVEVAKMPVTHELHSFNPYYFSTNNATCLNDISPGDLVTLNGIKAKASEPKGQYTDYVVFLNVITVEKASGITLCDLYQDSYVKKQLTPSWLTPLPNTDENSASRYDSNSIYIDIHAINEDSHTNRYISSRLSRGDPKSPWVTQSDPPRPKASLPYTIQQWKSGDYDLNNETLQKVLVDLNIYDSLLQQFCIVDKDVKTFPVWKALAPIIFDNLQYKAICQVDKTSTRTSYGGLNGEISKDEKVDFGISLRASCIIADIVGVYRKIGVPVTGEWVCSYYNVPFKPNSNSTFFSVLSMDKEEDRAKVLGSQTTEYRVLVNFNVGMQKAKTWSTISGLSADQGVELMTAIQNATTSDEEPTFSNEGVSFLYQKINTPMAMSVCALSNRSEDVGVSGLRNDRIGRFLKGVSSPSPPKTLSIEYTSTAPRSGGPSEDTVGNSRVQVLEEAPRSGGPSEDSVGNPRVQVLEEEKPDEGETPDEAEKEVNLKKRKTEETPREGKGPKKLHGKKNPRPKT